MLAVSQHRRLPGIWSGLLGFSGGYLLSQAWKRKLGLSQPPLPHRPPATAATAHRPLPPPPTGHCLTTHRPTAPSPGPVPPALQTTPAIQSNAPAALAR